MSLLNNEQQQPMHKYKLIIYKRSKGKQHKMQHK